MSRKVNVCIAVIACCIGLAIAALPQSQFGKIKGHITDKETGEAVIGASVQVASTDMGSLTDPSGWYTIPHVPPGTYTLRITAVEYNTVEVTNVVVKADLTTEVNQRLDKKVAELGNVITVTAGGADPVEKYETQTQIMITTQPIEGRPVQSLDQLIQRFSGVQMDAAGQVIIRGGRAGEVAYIVDGVPVDHTSHGGSAIVNGEPFDAMFFKAYGVNPFVDTEDDSLSTFAIDVDDASYVMARSYLERGYLPPDEAIRAEEFINRFEYQYPSPRTEPFSINIDGAPSRFGSAHTWLLRIGIQGFNIPPEHRKPANLVFVIDVSGSMNMENRLGLVKQALGLLLNELTPDDRVGIVVYGSTGQVLLEPVSAGRQNVIRDAIQRLVPGGSTYAEQGIRLGYEMADRMFDRRRLNRIILCSDGVANVGTTDHDAILEQIKEYARKGITLTAVGFGMANFNDILMEQLGDKGNGHYAYVDDIEEARRVFIDNLTGTLQVIARDVKIQAEFDPEVVRSYRLIGYENRDVADKDFRNDTVDGGEIGSGHRVTALYELKLHVGGPVGTLGKISVRHKDADLKTVREVSRQINREQFLSSFSGADADFRLAATAAQFAEILRKSYWAKGEKLADVLATAEEVYHDLRTSESLELLTLVQKACDIDRRLAKK